MEKLTALLRLAVLTHRERSPRPVPPLRLTPVKGGLNVTYAAEWLGRHPLTHADFEAEAAYLAPMGFKLVASVEK